MPISNTTITAATPPPTPVLTVTQPSCGVTTGTITVTTPAQGSGYEYSIDGTTFQASNISSGVSAGAKTITIRSTADNTCTATANTTITAATPPPTPVLSVTQPSCGVTTGTITVTTPSMGDRQGVVEGDTRVHAVGDCSGRSA